MARRSGLQAEVLASLALVMAAATGVLAVVLVTYHEETLRPVLAGALAIEARTAAPAAPSVVRCTRWWVVAPGGAARPREPGGPPPDAMSLALAGEARAAGAPLLRPGARGEPIRFAMPLDSTGRVALARLPEAASLRLRSAPRRVALGVLAADAAIFTVFGATLLRRRLVLPLRRLRDAAGAIAEGQTSARVPVEGARETADLALAFNTMSEALERRTGDLEKAVAELRAANRNLRQARAGLDRAERLAAVGRLAAGVAHEVGNPMGAIMAFVDLARRDPELSAAGREHLDRAAREGQRVREILRQLLDFSRPGGGLPAPVDLAAAAEETAALVRAQSRYDGVAIRVACEPGTGAAHADRGAVSQILLNLLLNAADAAAGRPAPEVRVRVQPAVLAVRAGEEGAAARQRGCFDAVECIVEDNGAGIPEADWGRVFDPFFTTKEPGEGTGLGLANALRLAEDNGGALELAPSGAGGGAVFVLRLPAAAAPGGSAVRSGSST